ncbi:hypothetical protein D3C80_1545020 [compost metagenome]
MGVDRQFAATGVVPGADEFLGFAAFDEAELFQLRQHERGEVVVDHRGLEGLRAKAGLPVQLLGNHAHLRQVGDVVAVE